MTSTQQHPQFHPNPQIHQYSHPHPHPHPHPLSHQPFHPHIYGGQSQSQPSSPLSTKFKHQHHPPPIDPTQIIPLDHASRTTPIHASLPGIKLPSLPSDAKQPNHSLNPVTLKPFSVEDLKYYGYVGLRAQLGNNNSNTTGTNGNGNGTTNINANGGGSSSSEAARVARDEAIAELKSRLDEAERRAREIEREMEEKEKTREIERKVWAKRRGEGAG